MDPASDKPRPGPRARCKPQGIFLSCGFWPEAGEVPTARQVRRAIEDIEHTHMAGGRVLLNGVGHPARAAIVAGCWLAREGCGGDLVNERLRWWDEAQDTTGGIKPPYGSLSAAEHAFVAAWPTGREGQPELVDVAWTDRDEVFPTAPVEHWLRVLPAVRVYPGVRGEVRPVDAAVLNGQHVSDSAGINLRLEELRRGTWIGERTLRLPNGWQMVFIPS